MKGRRMERGLESGGWEMKNTVVPERSRIRGLLWLALVAVLTSAANECLASYNGQLVSASYKSHLDIGESLVITFTVKNTGTSSWLGGSRASFVRKLYWTVGGSTTALVAYDYTQVAPGASATRTITVTPSSLPSSSAGSYTIYLGAYYPESAFPSTYYMMSGAPKAISYTIGSTPVISVTPSTLDFGSVEVGSTADRTFTVKNNGSGTLSGSASVSAPFSIVSGGSYSLGSGASQTVTVRYSPTAVGSHSRTVSFTGGGGASRAVSGSAYLPDVVTPTFTPDGGEQPTVTVTVTVHCATAGATIRYTTDGSLPTESSSVVASGGTVAVPVPGTIKARAYKSGMNPSAVRTANYTEQMANGIPVYWLTLHGLPTDGSANDQSSPDGSGFTIREQWRAGTNPNDPEDVLRMTGVLSGGPHGVTIRWRSVSNRTYRVERSGNLQDTPPFAALEAGIQGLAGFTEHTDQAATGPGPFFYRIVVE
jgi:hypothetical protein